MHPSLHCIKLSNITIFDTLNWDLSGNSLYDQVYTGKYNQENVLLFKMTTTNRARISIERKVGTFYPEIYIQQTFKHKNILKIIGYSEIDKQSCYLVCEYFKGITLRQYLSTHKISPKKSLKLIGQISDGLIEIHKNGIIHCDVASCNILVNDKLEPKIFNFALSLQNHQTDKMNEGIGLGYKRILSPETLLDNKVSSKSDIWQLGILFYEILTSEELFPSYKYNDQEFKSLIKSKTIKIDKPKKMPREIHELICSCCIYEFDKRLNLESLSAYSKLKIKFLH